MNILCIGKLTYDIFCPMEKLPEANQKYMNKERIECGGGEVANATYLLGKWGTKPFIAGVVGSDDFGSKIKKEFDGVQVDTSLIETSYEKPTILSFIIVNKNDGSNIITRNYKTDFMALRKQDLGIVPDIILADGHEYGATHLMLERNPKALSILMAEENKPEILELCKFSKYVFLTKLVFLTLLNNSSSKLFCSSMVFKENIFFLTASSSISFNSISPLSQANTIL